MHGTERSPGHREVLAVGCDRTVADIPGAGHHAVGRKLFFFHSEVVAGVLGVHAELHERPLLEEVVQPVAGGHETLFPPGLQLVFAAAGKDFFTARFQLFDEFFFNGHGSLVG